MKEVYGSIWVHYLVHGHFVCLTTNGTIKKNGEAVMGRGNAKQAKIVIPDIARVVGLYLKQFGNTAGLVQVDGMSLTNIVIFPVKHNWWEKADLALIEQGRNWLWTEATNNPSNVYHLPRPGCGNGGRDWKSEVRPLIANLPDNVWVHHLDDIERMPE